MNFFSHSFAQSYKFAAANFQTDQIEHYGNSTLNDTCKSIWFVLIILVNLLPNVSHVVQHENDPDIVLICQNSKKKFCLNWLSSSVDLDRITIVNSNGKIRPKVEIASGLDFDYDVRSLSKKLHDELEQKQPSFVVIVSLEDSVLAFHQHGMQGKSLKNSEMTQEIYDETRSFRVIGHDRLIVLQSRPVHQSASASSGNTPSDLYILLGHENT